jgi:hypothetical protein
VFTVQIRSLPNKLEHYNYKRILLFPVKLFMTESGRQDGAGIADSKYRLHCPVLFSCTCDMMAGSAVAADALLLALAPVAAWRAGRV